MFNPWRLQTSCSDERSFTVAAGKCLGLAGAVAPGGVLANKAPRMGATAIAKTPGVGRADLHTAL
jgi:hypothetical protein